MICLIDTFSWIDYFDANDAGQKVKQYIENPNNEIFTNILSLAEIASCLARRKAETEQLNEVFKIIFSNSKIYNFDAEFSKNVGLLHSSMKNTIKDFGLVDAFILLTARKLKAKIITGDEHFRSIKEAILVK